MGTFEPSTPEPESAPAPLASTELLARLAQLREQATNAHAEFVAAAPKADMLAARALGAEIGSDAWADAQVALGELDSARSTAALALGDLDLLFADATLAKESQAEIAATRESVLALLSEEDRTLAELRGKVQG